MSQSLFREGFYAVFFAGSSGEGYGVFIFRSGRILGADPLGVTFDGQYAIEEDGQIGVQVHVSVPADGQVVQGVTSGPSGIEYDISMMLPADFAESQFVRVETPLGPVNARFKWLRTVE